jgi:hypothetical protein
MSALFVPQIVIHLAIVVGIAIVTVLQSIA